MIFDDIVDGQSTSLFSVACNLGSKKLAALQTVETVVHTHLILIKHRLDADRLPMLSGGGTRQGFCRDLDPLVFE